MTVPAGGIAALAVGSRVVTWVACMIGSGRKSRMRKSSVRVVGKVCFRRNVMVSPALIWVGVEYDMDPSIA